MAFASSFEMTDYFCNIHFKNYYSSLVHFQLSSNYKRAKLVLDLDQPVELEQALYGVGAVWIWCLAS